MSLAGKRALVTGSSRGIGAAIALRLSKEGATVVVNYRNSEAEARSVTDSIGRSRGRALLVQADVSEPAQVDAMYSKISKELGGLDILVNNAGLADSSIWNAELAEITPEMWQRVTSVDLVGTFLCTQKAVPLMENGGRIVNIASTPAITGDVDGLVYSPVKASVLSLTKSMALLLAPKIAVNCMVLGAIDTTWVNWLSPRQVKELKKTIPLRRFGSPEEVASVAVFFAGEASSFITGQSLIVDGGEVMR